MAYIGTNAYGSTEAFNHPGQPITTIRSRMIEDTVGTIKAVDGNEYIVIDGVARLVVRGGMNEVTDAA